MAGPLRIEFVRAVYHITSRENGKQANLNCLRKIFTPRINGLTQKLKLLYL